MKWLLLIGLIFLIANRRHLVGDLVQTAKKLPKDFKTGKKAAEDPVSAAKPITASTPSTSSTSSTSSTPDAKVDAKVDAKKDDDGPAR